MLVLLGVCWWNRLASPGLHQTAGQRSHARWATGAALQGLVGGCGGLWFVYGLSMVCLWSVYGLSMVDVVVLDGAGDGIARRLSVESSRTPGSSSDC